jgi:hypothetical protein
MSAPNGTARLINVQEAIKGLLRCWRYGGLPDR